MEWIWITLIVFGYIVIGSIISGLGKRWRWINDDGILVIIVMPFWPIVILIALLCPMCIAIMDWIAKEK